jgi:fatty acid amide hydrolase
MSESTVPSSKPLHTLTASEISEGLAAGSLRSVDVVEALIERRRTADGALGSFVSVCDGAMQDAEAADKARKEGTHLSPLHGVPMTIKESVDLLGHDSTLGIAARQNHPAKRDAVLVAELRRLGAVFLGKTNVPQALLAQETENHLYGVTSNPWALSRTPGGSSGGEAAAVAAGLSPLGIGTDIGGSIRIPAHFCGLVGFKPTLDTWSNRGSNTAIKGQELVRAQIGTLSRSVEDVQLLWRNVDASRMAAGDPLVSPRATSSAPDLRGMTIGVVDDDDFLPPVASIRRAVREARTALEEAGATVVSHWPVASKDILATWLAGLSSDRGRTLLEALGKDSVSQQLKASTALIKVPSALRKHLGGLLGVLGEKRLAMLMDVLGEKTVTDFWRLVQRRTDLRLAEFDAWQRADLDALICPPHVVPAIGHRQSGDFTLSLGPMFRWTLLNFPAGVVPITRVRSDETNSYDGGEDRIAKKVRSIMEGSAGLPVGVQVVAKPFHEHTLLAVMSAIESRVKTNEGYPVTPIDVAK